jgi:hypothetical protein
MAKRAGRRSGEAKAAIIARQIRKEQLRSGKAVEAGVTRRGFDVQHKTGSGSKPTLMASQQMERAAKLQDPEVRAELNRRVREYERKCLPVTGSARFHRRVRVQGNRPRTNRLRASGVRVVQEQCARDATGCGDPAGGYAIY